MWQVFHNLHNITQSQDTRNKGWYLAQSDHDTHSHTIEVIYKWQSFVAWPVLFQNSVRSYEHVSTRLLALSQECAIELRQGYSDYYKTVLGLSVVCDVMDIRT